MGIHSVLRNQITNNMKVLLIVALAIAAVMAEPEADADAAVYYGGYYGHPGYYGYGGYRHGYYNRYGYGNYYGLRHFGKRSAEADAAPEADADAAVYYGGYYGHPRAYGYGLYNRGYYGGYSGYPYVTGYGYARHFGKRSADAEPEADADAAVYYGGYYGHPGYYG